MLRLIQATSSTKLGLEQKDQELYETKSGKYIHILVNKPERNSITKSMYRQTHIIFKFEGSRIQNNIMQIKDTIHAPVCLLQGVRGTNWDW